VRSEVALLFLGYILKRAYKVLGFKEIMARLDAISPHFLHQLLKTIIFNKQSIIAKRVLLNKGFVTV